MATPLSNKCKFCQKTVYDQEKQLYQGGMVHDFCFKCNSCKKKLDSGSQVEHLNKPYCKSCYDKEFRPSGYSNSGVSDSFKPAAAAAKSGPSSPTAARPTVSASIAASAAMTAKAIVPGPAATGGTGGAAAGAKPAASASTGGKYCGKCGDIKVNGACKKCAA